MACNTLADELLDSVTSLPGRDMRTPAAITECIKAVFRDCDSKILDQARGIIARRGALECSSALSSADECWNGKHSFVVTGKRPERAGSCAVVALFVEDYLYLAHIG